MSLYAEYLQERLNKEIIETDKGFVTYYFIGDGCYIEDVYIRPDFRRQKLASQFGDQIAEIAKEKGFLRLYGSVNPKAKHATESMAFLISYGFKLLASDLSGIVLIKDLE
jgi:GNAT superfamily N-acetyltransferase